jgi:transcriptional regulator with XRE-family HTH domain
MITRRSGRHHLRRLRELRLAKGLSQDELARLSGTSQAKVSRGERGFLRFTEVECDSLARCLGVTLGDLGLEPDSESSERRPTR